MLIKLLIYIVINFLIKLKSPSEFIINDHSEDSELYMYIIAKGTVELML